MEAVKVVKNTAATSTVENEAFWKGHAQSYKTSGLTRAKYPRVSGKLSPLN